MASMTIRNLDDGLKQALRVRAAENGVSMEAEARRLLAEGLGKTASQPFADETPWDRLQRIKSANGGGFDLELPLRSDWVFGPVDLSE